MKRARCWGVGKRQASALPGASWRRWRAMRLYRASRRGRGGEGGGGGGGTGVEQKYITFHRGGVWRRGTRWRVQRCAGTGDGWRKGPAPNRVKAGLRTNGTTNKRDYERLLGRGGVFLEM